MTSATMTISRSAVNARTSSADARHRSSQPRRGARPATRNASPRAAAPAAVRAGIDVRREFLQRGQDPAAERNPHRQLRNSGAPANDARRAGPPARPAELSSISYSSPGTTGRGSICAPRVNAPGVAGPVPAPVNVADPGQHRFLASPAPCSAIATAHGTAATVSGTDIKPCRHWSRAKIPRPPPWPAQMYKDIVRARPADPGVRDDPHQPVPAPQQDHLVRQHRPAGQEQTDVVPLDLHPHRPEIVPHRRIGQHPRPRRPTRRRPPTRHPPATRPSGPITTAHAATAATPPPRPLRGHRPRRIRPPQPARRPAPRPSRAAPAHAPADHPA